MKHTGLSNEQVKDSRSRHGNNELSEIQSEGFWTKLLNNFKEPIIYILLVALVVILVLSFFGMTEWYEAVAIAIAVLLLPAGNVVTSHISATEASPDCGKALGGFWSHSEWLVNGHSGRDGVSTSRTEMPWTISRWNSTCLRACNIRDKL